MPKAAPNYWVFSNKPAGSYDGSIWDHGSTLRTKKYYFEEAQPNRHRVQPGDVAVLKTFQVGFIGQFEVGQWHGDEIWPSKRKGKVRVGFFDMKKLDLWKRPLPHKLITPRLSNRNPRARLLRITADDLHTLDIARWVYERLGLGPADGEVVVLEKGLEEAIKPNLAKLGLKPFSQQQSHGIGVGRSDLIYEDKHGDLVVVELKRGLSSERVVGQILKYIGAVRSTIARDGQKVHGWIVTGDYDKGLQLAADEAKIRLLRVRLP